MRFNVKAVCIAAVFLLLTACAGKHYTAENISELFDRDWMIGKSCEEIEAKYRDFDREYIDDAGQELGAFYINYDNHGIDPSYIHDTYFVVFENGVAVDAYFRETSIGG